MKLIYYYFNKQTGKSIVTLADKYGTYTGKAKCHPNDLQYISEFMGGVLAQNRAMIKLLKNKIHREKIRKKTIQNIFQDIKSNISNIEEIRKRLEIQLKNCNNEINKTNQQIKEIQNNIKTRIQVRDDIVQKYKNRD